METLPDEDVVERGNGLATGIPLAGMAQRYATPRSVSPYSPWLGSGESAAELHRRGGGDRAIGAEGYELGWRIFLGSSTDYRNIRRPCCG